MSSTDLPPAETRRVFIALPVKSDAVPRIQRIQARFASEANRQRIDLRLTPPHQFHVTLAFLGAITTNALDLAVQSVLRIAATTAAFRVRASGPVLFPSPRHARIFGLGLDDPSGSLTNTAAALHADLRGKGFALEKRTFTPHVTLARLRKPTLVAAVTLDLDERSSQYVFDTLTIYQSELGTKGSKYWILHSTELR